MSSQSGYAGGPQPSGARPPVAVALNSSPLGRRRPPATRRRPGRRLPGNGGPSALTTRPSSAHATQRRATAPLTAASVALTRAAVPHTGHVQGLGHPLQNMQARCVTPHSLRHSRRAPMTACEHVPAPFKHAHSPVLLPSPAAAWASTQGDRPQVSSSGLWAASRQAACNRRGAFQARWPDARASAWLAWGSRGGRRPTGLGGC
jgi:hypothetical protein